jgi:predicted RNA-binding Zn-ribbon protein involved in translation (DUF1610 family)
VVSDASAVHFPCPKCGAPEMAWNAAAQQMHCPYCQHQMVIPAQESEPASPSAPPAVIDPHHERTLAEGFEIIRSQAGTGLGTEVRTIACRTCGATVSFAGVAIASACDFCGSDQVLEQESKRSLIRPQSLVPFGVEQERARAKFRTWLAGLWFRPNNLKHKAAVGEINGVYVPYWTFDAGVASQWTAQAGYYYYVTVSYTTQENGRSVQRTRQERRTRWEHASGRRSDSYDDVLVVASRGLPTTLAEKLKTFDTAQLVAYDPRYLAGWRAEEYAVELDEGWSNGKAKMERGQYVNCGRDVPGDTQRGLSVQNQFSNETFKHILMPIWIASYRYEDKPYRFLVNGQTGEVTGEAPWSWIKITLFTLLMIAIAAGIGYAFYLNR